MRRGSVDGRDRAATRRPRKGPPPKSETRKPRLRLKVFWGVYNDSLQRVALFEYTQRREAEAAAREMSEAGKTSCFVRRVKEPVE